jgi:CDP-paratose synthetase
MRILLTGATGFIGRWLVPCLSEAGHEVRAIVRSSTDTSGLAAAGVPYIVDDGIQNMGAALQAHKPFDGIIHLSSLFLYSHKTEDVLPLLSANVVFPVRLLDAAVQNGIRWFINTGTVWQHYEDKPYSPVNLYAASKQAFESLARYYVEAHGLRFATLALCDTYGPGDTRAKLLRLWCQIAHRGTALDMSEGMQKIDLIYAADVAKAFRLLAEHQASSTVTSSLPMPTFSISSGEVVSLRELAAVFEEVTEKTLPIRWGARPMRPREVMIPWSGGLSVPRWCPTVSLRAGIRLTWKAFSAAIT